VLKPGTKQCGVCGYEFAIVREASQREIEHDTEGRLQKIESRVYIYPEPKGEDVGKDSLIDVAKEKKYNPGWIKFRERALEEARDRYRTVVGGEPKEHWTAGMMGSMIRQKERSAE
jgi:hypothetical protein